MLPGFAKYPVTVERAPYVTLRGTQVRDWEHPSSWVIEGCYIDYSSTSTRWTDVSQAVTIQARCYMPPSANVLEGDRILHDGRMFSVNGAPMVRRSPSGALSHIECALIDWSS